MAGIKYRVFLGNQPASRTQLDLIEEITVEQAIDGVWEARVLMYICADEHGAWKNPDPAFGAHKRLRVEIDPGNQTFTALIDGTIVETQPDLRSEPGQSTHTIVVDDDSVLVDKDEVAADLPLLPDNEIATRLYKQAQILTVDLDPTLSKSSGGLPVDQFQRGSAMQFLRNIAERRGMHAYVLPGKLPGASIGVLKPLPTKAENLPSLELLGPNRNFENFSAGTDHQSPASIEAYSLSVVDKKITHAVASFQDVPLLGELPASDDMHKAPRRLLPPGLDGAVDAATAVNAAALKLSYATKASGTTIRESYLDVLSPYRTVVVGGVQPVDAGLYVINSVTHKLTRSAYEQSFTLIRNATTRVEMTVTQQPAGALIA